MMFAAPTRRKGMMLSLAMACRSRGAPVSDCSPAPHVEKKEPITMTQGVGQARVPTTRFPLTESPNLWESRVKAMIGVEEKECPSSSTSTHRTGIHGQALTCL